MRDDISSRLTDLGRAAERSASPVDFERIRQRARRRRRAQTLSAAVLCVAVAAGVGVTVGQTGGPSRTIGPVHRDNGPQPTPPTRPSPTARPTPTRTSAPRLTARRIVADPRSFVLASSVFPGDVNQAATLWELGPAGRKAQFALTTTTDGYQHVRYVSPPAQYRRDCNDVRAVGSDEFWLSCALEDELVRSDGSVEVATFGHDRGAVPNDAVLFPAQSTGGGVGSNWIDSQGVFHMVHAPGSASLKHAPDGRIWGLAYWTPQGSNRLIWSSDRGGTWSSRALPGPAPSHTNEAYEVVPTAVSGQMVLARGSAETVFQPRALMIFGPDGRLQKRVTFSIDPGAMDSAVVTPDGSLVMDLYNEPEGGRTGLYRGAPGAWGTPEKVLDAPRRPGGRAAGAMFMGTSRDSSGHRVVWAVFDTGVLATSTDDGQTWTTHNIR